MGFPDSADSLEPFGVHTNLHWGTDPRTLPGQWKPPFHHANPFQRQLHRMTWTRLGIPTHSSPRIFRGEQAAGQKIGFSLMTIRLKMIDAA